MRALALAALLLVAIPGVAAASGTAAEADALAAAYVERGGRPALGPILGPGFRRPNDPALYLATQVAVLGTAGPVDAMAWFTEAGRDDWLETVRGVPKPILRPGYHTEHDRRGWLSQPDLARAHAAQENALGLPTSEPRRFGPFISQRFDRGVLQLWLDAVPGAPEPGSITTVLVGELLAEAGLLPFPPRPALPPSVAPGDIVVRTESPDAVAITYDMGSIDSGLEGVLVALSSRNLRATFFVTGDFSRRYEWAIPAILASGHELANHTVTHPELRTFPTWRIGVEVDELDAWLAARGAPPPVWFRPPFGAYDRRVQSTLAARGYPLVMWRLDLADWRDEITPGDVIRIARSIRAGDVVVTHGGLPKTAAAMPQVLDELAARGLRQVTLSELYR